MDSLWQDPLGTQCGKHAKCQQKKKSKINVTLRQLSTHTSWSPGGTSEAVKIQVRNVPQLSETRLKSKRSRSSSLGQALTETAGVKYLHEGMTRKEPCLQKVVSKAHKSLEKGLI